MDKDLAQIVKFYRTPLRPLEVKELDDIKRFPNDILLSYVVGDLDLERVELTKVFTDPSALNEWFAAVIPQLILPKDLPSILPQEQYRMPMPDTAGVLRLKTKQFCHGTRSGALIVADQEKKEYVFPSGKGVPYVLLKNERVADISIFDCALAETGNETPTIYLREASLLVMRVLFDVWAGHAVGSKKESEEFERCVPGVLIAHELAELANVEAGKSYASRLELELDSERCSKQLLVEQGVPLRVYAAYHTLRAGFHEEISEKNISLPRGKNISRVVVEREFNP